MNTGAYTRNFVLHGVGAAAGLTGAVLAAAPGLDLPIVLGLTTKLLVREAEAEGRRGPDLAALLLLGVLAAARTAAQVGAAGAGGAYALAWSAISAVLLVEGVVLASRPRGAWRRWGRLGRRRAL